MSLASTLNTTKSIFNNTSAQSAVVSTNIQNASNTDYNKRSANTTVNIYSGAMMVTTERAQNSALLKQTLNAISSNSAQQQLVGGMESVSALLGGDSYSLAPSTYLATLRDKLKTYAETPGDITLAQTVVSAAQDVATSLNNTADGIQQLRGEADAEIATQVTKLNKLLSDFETANNEVIKKTAMGEDPNNAIDKREGLIKQISEIIGVSTYTREGNDIALYTSDGTTLFETVPRKISFTPTAAFAAGSTGSSLYIDGVKVEAGQGASTTAKGSLQALLQLRDDVLPTMQDQLDEVARGVIALFAEDSGGTAVAGLFTTKTGAAVAFDTTDIIPGLASQITVASSVVSSPFKLRDGNIAGTSTNTGNASGYSDLLRGYLSAFDTPMTFDGDTKLGTNVTLLNFSTEAVGWTEDFRSNASTAGESTSALMTRASEAYSNNTGVNLDEELILLLDIEQSYKAASKLLSTIDEMLKALMAAT
ncbi:flagellar hook-associated protein FlgK [Allorhizobium borbori]|jgi:flagellar hook-associated protein 1 FlgK|uniref:Flagellar hook-associated protein 1 n=1 Tax=Allorhizobium borbori TaxID=485907 RepID=A0A7W6K5N4_9HYPH|nr:flagellar hook-associated protein FlgK [Allorhizobium borbori]MBB4104600.1 flagellar hook-associated protein 1 FlgK [Allorhizobium borbori]PZU18466.1 MAG: flagellar hook-associated protein FlgK [Shinella sp.]